MRTWALRSSFILDSMNSRMSGWSTFRITIFAARRVLPPLLITPANASKPFMKLTGPEAMPPPESDSLAAAQGREIRARAGAPLEEHALGLGEVHDGIHVVLDGIDEARRALRLGLHADVEPHRRIEGHLLLDQQVGEFVAKRVLRFGVGEIAAFVAPADDGIDHAANQLPHRGFALVGVGLPVKIFGRHDIGGRLRPALGHFYVLLPENYLSLVIADECGAPLPFDLVEGGNLAVGKPALEVQAGRLASFLFRGHGSVQDHPCFCHHLPPRRQSCRRMLAGVPGGSFPNFTPNCRNPEVVARIE